MKLKRNHIILILFLALAIGIVISTVSDLSTYSDFEEASKHPDKEFHIIGKLNTQKPIETILSDNHNTLKFFMFDKFNNESKVTFNGDKPQDFEKSEQIVIMGSMKNDNFVATNILLKCPSKYDKKGYDTEEEYKSNY